MSNSPTLANHLRLRGYSVLPTPQQVEWHDGTVRLDATWHLALAGVSEKDIAVRTLVSALQDEHDLQLLRVPSGSRPLRLCISPDAVQTGAEELCRRQAYIINCAPDEVELLGNTPQGLFYAVQTFLQLLDNARPLALPCVTIRDWPRYALRMIHWDTKHHQDRPETLYRYFDQLAHLKVNAVSFEIEDKFAYPSHPIIGAPGAFTVEQMQQFTRYAMERHIQFIPNVQAPAHFTYVLKHPQFAHLKCDGSNYMACVEDPEAQKLIFDMYSDCCRATPEVEYFHVSTDEVYYAGICQRSGKPYTPENRSLIFVEFVRNAYEHLTKLGRKVIIWAEFPLLAEHIKRLPNDIIDGIVGNEIMLEEELKHGMRHLAYASMQGEELLFPNYFATFDDHGGGGSSAGRLEDARLVTTSSPAARGNPIGTFSAAWEDSGLHSETFWLGWATMAGLSWSPGSASVDQIVTDFQDIHYGRSVSGMTEIYQLMQTQARFFQSVWDRPASIVRPPAYGSSHAKRPVSRQDWTLTPPGLPRLPDLLFEPGFSTRYARLIAQGPQRLADNDRLIGKLQESLPRAARNRHGLEVFLAIAALIRHTIQLLLSLAAVEEALTRAYEAHRTNDPTYAAALLRRAHKQVSDLIEGRRAALQTLEHVWEKGRFPRNRSVAGRDFLHVMDDVKDHFADRRPDLSYMTAPEESLHLESWRDDLAQLIQTYTPQSVS